MARSRQLLHLAPGPSVLACRDRAILKLYLYSGIRLAAGCRLFRRRFSQLYADDRYYSGQSTTTTDEAGAKRTTSVDGLGRLSSVQEDPNGSNYTTVYSYDALGDLVSVNQSGETRSFLYDSQKRLIGSTNPETWTNGSNPAVGCSSGGVFSNCYYYDANGNLTSKLDNRGVGVAYAFDPLNRMLSKTYINIPGTTNILAASYKYDDPSVPFSRGRLTSASTQTGNVSTMNYSSYDPLGRIIKSNQVTAGQTYPFSYFYNLADTLTSEVYPSDRTVNTCYDVANRVTQVSLQACSSSTGAYATGVSYAPQGSPVGYTMGNGDVRQFGYNSRLQMTSLSDSVNGQMLFQGTMNYGGAPLILLDPAMG